MPLEGDRVRLREERLDDVPLLLSLRNDMATQGWNQALPPDYTEAMERQRLEKREYSLDRTDARFIIERKDSGEAIGLIRYSGLVPRWEATIGLSTVQSAWGSGLAFDAQEALLAFLFLDLGIRVVRLWTNDANARALRLAERSGFQVAMRAREDSYKSGRRFGVVLMDLLREEWFVRHPGTADDLPPL
jgi:[ribosomal protein S5]-alanine N-acetyltransferase